MATAITSLEAEPQVKECLLALFTFELTSSGNKNAPFKKNYESEISKQADRWNVQGGDE